MRWAVEIQRTGLDTRNLTDLLHGLECVVVDGPNSVAFTSRKMEECASAREVFEIGKSVREAFAGVAQVDPMFELGSVIDYSSDPPKRAVFGVARTAIVTVLTCSGTLSVSQPKGLSDDELKRWEEEKAEREYQAKLETQRQRLEPAFHSAEARKVLALLQERTPSGDTLNKVYELMEGDQGNRTEFHRQFGITEHQFDRFRDAVHNPKVSGFWARHALERKPRTSDPMSKSEAEAFIRKLAARWLEHVRKAHGASKP